MDERVDMGLRDATDDAGELERRVVGGSDTPGRRGEGGVNSLVEGAGEWLRIGVGKACTGKVRGGR